MTIHITYKLKSSNSIENIKLSTAQYFDKIVQHANYEKDEIAKYNQERNYISDLRPDVQIDDLEYTTIAMKGSIKSDFVTKTNYYGKDTMITYRKDEDGAELLIQSIRVATNCIVITRMERPSNISEWRNINLNVGLNYNHNDTDQEKWYNSTKGEFINQVLTK